MDFNMNEFINEFVYFMGKLAEKFAELLIVLIAFALVVGYILFVWAVRILLFIGAIYLIVLVLRAVGVAI